MNENEAPAFSAGENGLSINEPIAPEKREPIEAPKNDKLKSGLIIKLVIAILAVGLIAFAATQIDYVAVVDNMKATGYEPSADMAALINDLSLTSDGTRIMNATRPELQEAEEFNQNCNNDKDGSSTLGCYSGSRIYIYNIARVDLDGIRQVTLAHEFLHAVWERMSESERNELKEPIESIYNTNEDIRKQADLYRTDERINELHSFIGSQVSPNNMPAVLRDHYAKYFSEHSKLAAFYNKYHSIFEEAEKRASELKEQIAEHREKINEMKETYTRNNADLSQDISDFNSRARTGGFGSEEEFITQRQALVQRQTVQRQEYQNLVNYINETNSLISAYNDNALRSSDLYKSVDSNIKQPDSPTAQ
ncbi:hypothetical protein IKG50_01615 [Candidatus Saccharibacteria bacterium]|nr:hypothetical protein [Candidatus Saccharibacteria bacterium]